SGVAAAVDGNVGHRRRLVRIEVSARVRGRNGDQTAHEGLRAGGTHQARPIVAGRVVAGADVDIAEPEEIPARTDGDIFVRVDAEVRLGEPDRGKPPGRGVRFLVPH